MNNQATLQKMQQMRLYGMQNTFESLQKVSGYADYSPDQLVAHLVDAEWIDRENRKYMRLLKAAKFRYQAAIESMDYSPVRNLDKTQMLRLSDCSFITRGEHVIITGATGTGKTYITSALGHQACTKGYKVQYYNTAKLFSKLRMANADQSYLNETSKLEKQDLLILDDFGLQPIDAQNRLILLDIIEDRHIGKSTIITSQIPVSKWHDIIGDQTIADAILDRIVHQAHRIELKGESLRKNKKQETKTG